MTNPTLIRQWLGILHGDAAGHVQVCHTGSWAGRCYPTSDLDGAAAYATMLDDSSSAPAGVYVRVTTLRQLPAPGQRGGAADTLHLPALWADLDIAGPGHQHDPTKHNNRPLPPDEEAAFKIVATSGLPDPTIWVHSGGGLYPIWLLDTPHAIGDAEQLRDAQALSASWQRIIEHAAFELGWHYGRGVGDLARVLRIPGTTNRKVPSAEVPCVVRLATGTRYPYPELQAVAADALARLAPPPTEPTPATTFRPTGGGLSPGDDYNAHGDWAEIMAMAGGTEHYRGNEIIYYTRPGKPTDTSATINAKGTDRLHMHSTNWPPFEAGESYSKFGAYTLLRHGQLNEQTFRKAASELRQLGYGTRPASSADEQQAALAELLPGQLETPPQPANKPGRTSGKGTPSAYFNDNGLLVETLAGAVLAEWPCVLTQEDRVAVYINGVYRTNPMALSAAVGKLLGDRFQPKHRVAVTEFLAGRLYTEHRILRLHATEPLLNVQNGMLNLTTGVLGLHDPSYLSSTQLPVLWNPDATCPHYEQWITSMVPDQVDDIEETISTMLDPSRTPQKALFCFGPSRSGKSTFLRIAGAVAGAENVSAVTLHQLSENRFAAANVFGKILNSAADISSAHVEDISIFKMMTGEDPIHADRKYGGQFCFTNRALFAFSANSLPTIGESSRAYVERIKPFEFATSFAGKENPDVEAAMMAELPGILRRWVRAYQRLLVRGERLTTVDRVRQEFEVRSDRVHQWVADCCEITGETATPGMLLPPAKITSRRQLAREFNAWAKEQGGRPMGERKIIERLASINGVVEVRSTLDRSRGLNLRVTASRWLNTSLVAEVAETA